MITLSSVLLRDASQTFFFVGVPLVVTVGAFLLWKRTKRTPALVQFVAAVSLVMCSVLEWAHSFVNPFHKVWISKLVWSRYASEYNTGVMLISISVVAISYLWYALTQRSI